jgi:transcription-repair coupling factor (superfamily II helicase)
MQIADFLQNYLKDGIIQLIAENIHAANNGEVIQLKGLAGSLDAVVAAAAFRLHPQIQLFVLSDREEAAYFHNDLQNLLGKETEILFFPTSYKRPYQFEEIDNANVLQRAEVLNRVSQAKQNNSFEIIISYPEALVEKVINQRSLLQNTFTAKVGDKIDLDFLTELLLTYDFEKSDFVYEAGQFAVRGGIIDIYSYSNDLPYRIELFGDEIDTIRTFDPTSQLSVEGIKNIALIPNVQTKLLQEVRESFLRFIPKETKIWFKDIFQTSEVIGKYFEKAVANFNTAVSGDISLVAKPEALFETSASFEELVKAFTIIEFGKRLCYNNKNILEKLNSLPAWEGKTKVANPSGGSKPPEGLSFYDLESKPQPPFQKDFNLMAKHFGENQLKGINNLIAADIPKQFERLKTIFDEIDTKVKFKDLNIALREGFIDQQRQLACYTDHQLFGRFHRYKGQEKYSKSKALTLRELRSLQIGDYVTHVEYGVARFAGLEKVENNGKVQEAIRLVYRDDDILYVSIHGLHKIAKYTGKDGTMPSLSKLGSQEWENKKKSVKRKVKDIAKELIALYAKRKAAKGFAYTKDTYLQMELESSFIYEDTPDQAKATADVKADMEKSYPMDRLVCGDVGFGKTEVAIRAAFKAVSDSKQVAVLVPTTILAMQHYHTFKDRLANLPCTVDYINRFRTAKEVKQVLKDVESGKIDILIGTHRLVSKDVKFKNLGLMVIDEEQKFGVKVKEQLKEMKVNIDSLTLTATPIPRTLHFSLLGARDLSVIATPPPNRQPVSTEIHSFNEALIRDAVSYEVKRGGQVFFVHNRIGDIEQVANIILRLVPDSRVCYAHGQMDGDNLEKIMLKFIEGEYDVMVSTNIIESGLDIPNANTIVINNAQNFGLSDLHQMRGRVGRSNRKAFCYLLTPSMQGLSADARKKLSALEEFSELGDGFKIAMRDLDIRGAGNLLGGEQSGFINDVGYEMYHQILDEAMKELKESEFRELFETELKLTDNQFVTSDCSIETDMEILIPDYYVSNISERLQLYSKADDLENPEELEKFKAMLVDRFGKLPAQVQDLLKTVELRWVAEKIGFEKLTLKNETLKGWFVSKEKMPQYYQSEVFGKVLNFVPKNKNCQMKELNNKLMLIVKEIKNVNVAIKLLEVMVV